MRVLAADKVKTQKLDASQVHQNLRHVVLTKILVDAHLFEVTHSSETISNITRISKTLSPLKKGCAIWISYPAVKYGGIITYSTIILKRH